MPSCLSYFAESISIEHRGKAGGITLFASFFSMALMLVPLSTLDFVFSAAILVMWRAWSLPLVFLISERSPLEKGFKSRSMSSVLHNKAFLLYFAAWLMFSFVNSIEGVVVGLTAEFQFFIRIIEPAIASFSALIAGILSDWMGRRRVLISGFVSLGIAYATIGFLSQLWIAWLFYFIIDGIAIGALWVLFVLVLWGDLAQNGSEKFYAIGQTPFFLTEIIVLLSAPYLSSIPATSSFSLAAFFLFLAVLPLLYAQETLPEKSIRERELKIYVGQAKKIKEKHA
jgi:MFS family permease